MTGLRRSVRRRPFHRLPNSLFDRFSFFFSLGTDGSRERINAGGVEESSNAATGYDETAYLAPPCS